MLSRWSLLGIQVKTRSWVKEEKDADFRNASRATRGARGLFQAQPAMQPPARGECQRPSIQPDLQGMCKVASSKADVAHLVPVPRETTYLWKSSSTLLLLTSRQGPHGLNTILLCITTWAVDRGSGSTAARCDIRRGGEDRHCSVCRISGSTKRMRVAGVMVFLTSPRNLVTELLLFAGAVSFVEAIDDQIAIRPGLEGIAEEHERMGKWSMTTPAYQCLSMVPA